MEEKQIERRLVRMTSQMGGMALKFVSPGCDGVPDRLVLLPEGKVGFVEVKAPGKKPRMLQVKRHEKLRELGFQVFVLDATEDIPGLLETIAEGGDAQ